MKNVALVGTAVDFDDNSGQAVKIAAPNEDDLSVLREQQPFPAGAGTTSASANCITAGSDYVWMPSGESTGGVYQLASDTSSAS